MCLFIQVIFTPKLSKISQYDFTSLILGRFSIVHIPFTNNVAGIMATAAFFAPLIFTSPRKGVGPVITNFSNLIPPKLYLKLISFSQNIT